MSTVPAGILLLGGLAGCLATASPPEGEGAAPTHAVAVLHPVGESEVRGVARFVATEDGVRVTVRADGLMPGQQHGMHIHEFGDCTAEDATSAGDHFDPDDRPHGPPDAPEPQRHVGDLGNLQADEEGRGRYDRVDEVLALEGAHDIVGRSVIVHEGRDDLETQPTGDAGARLACGVIGVAEGE